MANYTEEQKAELEALRKQAELLGISFSGNTSLETLRTKVREVAGTPEEQDKEAELYQKLFDEKMRLVHCRVVCLDPMYKNSGGVFVSVSNAVLGSHKWFAPFNIPVELTQWCVDYLKSCKYVDRSEKGTRGANGLMHSKTVNTDRASYSVEILPQLTEAELKKLAEEQKATGRLENKE